MKGDMTVTKSGATIGSSRRKFRDGPVSFKNGNENWFETCGSGNPGLLEPRNDHGNCRICPSKRSVHSVQRSTFNSLWWLILLIGSGCFPLCNCIHISEPPKTIPACFSISGVRLRELGCIQRLSPPACATFLREMIDMVSLN